MANKGMTVFEYQGEEYLVNDQNIANEFSSGSYKKGELVYYQGKLFRFKEDHTGSWIGTDVVQATVVGELAEQKGYIDFTRVEREAAAENNLTYIPFSDMMTYANGYYINENGSLTGGSAHRVVTIPGENITRIYFKLMNGYRNLPFLFVYDESGTLQTPPVFRKVLELNYEGNTFYPHGLPKGSTVCFNWFNANDSSETRILEGVYIQYKDQDSRIVEGKNKFNSIRTYDGVGYNYQTGNPFANPSTSCSYGIDVDGAETITAGGGICHICFYDAYCNFISGQVKTSASAITTYNVPTGAVTLIISPDTSAKDGFFCSVDEALTGFVPYFLSFYTEAEPEGYQPYFDGFLFKTFSVPRKPVFDGTTYTNTAYLKLPASYTKSGKPTKLAIIVHGASKGIASGSGWTEDSYYNNIVNALITAGYAVMDSNGYNDSAASGHEHWGCPQALAGYVKAYDYFTKTYNLDRFPVVYGFSMGGLTTLNLMVSGMIPAKCVMIGAPVISLYNQCVETPEQVNADFLTAYNIQQYDREGLYGCDRYLDIMTVGSTPVVQKKLPPLFIAYGSTDTAISNSKIQEYYTALYNANHFVRIKSYTGGHEISYGGNQDVITDMINWFGAFN